MKFGCFVVAASIVGAGLFGGTGQATATPLCDPPNVMILFDVSGSMGSAYNATSKYRQAVAAIQALVTGTDSVDVPYQEQIRFGLFWFPDYNPSAATEGFCGVNIDHVIEPTINNAGTIISYIAYDGTNFFGGPTSKMDTPMYQAIQGVGDLASLNDPDQRSYVLLITDGMQDCCHEGDYDDDPDCVIPATASSFNPDSQGYNPFDAAEKAANRQDLVDLVALLKTNKNIQTFVVGFASGIDSVTLNRMAVAAGTATVTNCDTSVTSTDTCFYSTVDTATLEQAMQDIMVVVQTEVCDDIDNDCDGETDEDWPTKGESCSAGFGPCAVVGELVCNVIGDDVECDQKPGTGTKEECDGIDNDCNGKTDDGYTFTGIALGEPCDGPDEDKCEDGVVVCSGDKKNATCNETGPGRSETCNGKDEDCDGETDEGTDQACTSDCGSGMRHCVDGVLLPCDAPTPESKEICGDSIDNNCNSQTDEYFEEVCSTACGSGITKCENGQLTDCSATKPVAEVCDLVDNDCNGQTDDGNLCVPGSACFCGDCQVACSADGLCDNGLFCVDGFCLVDKCPDGQHCVDKQCIPGDKVPFEPDGTKPMGGCACRTSGGAGGSAEGWLFGLSLLALASWCLRRRPTA